MEKITVKHRGVTYTGTEEFIAQAIESRDLEQRTIYKSSVYTYSCRAIRLDDGRIKLTEWFDNGSSTKESFFDNKDLFWKRNNK